MKTQEKNFEKIGEEEFGKIQGKNYSDDEVKKVVKNSEKINSLLKSGALSRLADDVKVMIAMVKDYVSGAYRSIPVGIIMAVVGALLYVLSPVDAIPDYIPGIGFIDDFVVVTMCLNFVKIDLESYKKWASRRIKK